VWPHVRCSSFFHPVLCLSLFNLSVVLLYAVSVHAHSLALRQPHSFQKREHGRSHDSCRCQQPASHSLHPKGYHEHDTPNHHSQPPQAVPAPTRPRLRHLPVRPGKHTLATIVSACITHTCLIFHLHSREQVLTNCKPTKNRLVPTPPRPPTSSRSHS
jgi:hypothetical protein